MDVIDLRQRYGEVYKIGYEESHKAQRERTPDSWLLTIPCVHGEIYPFGGSWLAAATKKNGAVASQLRSLDCVTVV